MFREKITVGLHVFGVTWKANWVALYEFGVAQEANCMDITVVHCRLATCIQRSPKELLAFSLAAAHCRTRSTTSITKLIEQWLIQSINSDTNVSCKPPYHS